MADVSVLIAVNVGKVSMADVSAALVACGLRITRTRPMVGVIAGEVEAGRVDVLVSVPGVRTVKREHGVRLAPVHEGIPLPWSLNLCRACRFLRYAKRQFYGTGQESGSVSFSAKHSLCATAAFGV